MSVRLSAIVSLAAAIALAAPLVVARVVDDPPDITILDAAALEARDRGEGRGRVELLDVDGVLELKVDLDEVTTADVTTDDDGFLEVWLVENRRPTDEAAGQSLGPVRAEGRHVLPAGVDLDRFATILVTAEPASGDPTRSDDVIYRATLDLTPD